MSAPPVLYTFSISHFSEKVRWALDFEGIRFAERRLLPGLHAFTTRRLAKRNTVPVLCLGTLVVQGSDAIIEALPETFAAARLRPESGSSAIWRELQQLTDRAFGKGVQQIAYRELLREPWRMRELWALGGPRWANAFYAVTFPLLSRLLKRSYRISDANAERAKADFRAALSHTDRLLSQHEFLLGPSLTIADISIPALISPFLAAPEHPIPLPPLPPALQEFADEVRASATGQHALRMYREHRAPRPGLSPGSQ